MYKRQALQPSCQVDDSEMPVKAEGGCELQTNTSQGPLGSHFDSSFTPVGITPVRNALAINAAISPGQQLTGNVTAAVSPMQTGSVCSAAGSDGGALDMHEIELDAMVESGSPQDAVRHVEAGSNVEAVTDRRVGSGTFKQNIHDASMRSHSHYHVKAHREATLSPATTLWENPEPTGVRLLPAPAPSADSRSITDRLMTHELPQNTDAGPSKSGASGIVHEPSLDVHSAMHVADDQWVSHTPLTNSTLSQASHTVPSQVVSESSSHAVGPVVQQSVVQPASGPDASNIARNDSVDFLSEELARSNISSVNYYSHTLNTVPLKPSHVGVVQMSGMPTSESVVTALAGNIMAGSDVTQSPQSLELKPSVDSEVDRTHGMSALQIPDATKQDVKHAADHNKNSQGNVHMMQVKAMNTRQGIPSGEEIGSVDVEASSQEVYDQQKTRQEFDNSARVMKSKQQVPSSASDVPDEQHRASRYRPEVDRPRSRQDDVDQVNGRRASRQDYDGRDYSRPRSRQNCDDDRGYDRPHSRPGYDYGYQQPQHRQVAEDYYGRPRSRQGYEDEYYYRPRSRQGYDDRRDIPAAGQSYIYPEDGREGRHDRPSSRQNHHDPVDRPRSRQEYDYRPSSRQDYEDRSVRGSRHHEAASTRYLDNRYGDADIYKRLGSDQEFLDRSRDSRNPDESYSRARYNASDEGYDRTSWHGHQEESNDPRYRASQGYREEEYRRPRSRGGKIVFFS